MSKIDLSKYGITGTTEVVYNPSYEQLFEEETKPTLEGYEKGQESEKILRTLFGGLLTSTRTTTTQLHRRLGSLLRNSLSRNFQIRDFS